MRIFIAAPAGKEWWQVLGVAKDAKPEEIKAAYRKLAAEHHPDKGGDQARMAEINKAYEESGNA